ncbi:MAG: hypothetical protein R3E09_06575 [Novosphingobium sp.]
MKQITAANSPNRFSYLIHHLAFETRFQALPEWMAKFPRMVDADRRIMFEFGLKKGGMSPYRKPPFTAEGLHIQRINLYGVYIMIRGGRT